MQRVYTADGKLFLTVDVQSLATGWRVAWNYYSGETQFSRNEETFASSAEALAFAGGLIRDARLQTPGLRAKTDDPRLP